MEACGNHRTHSHEAFKDLAKRGKARTGWFYGPKPHLVIMSLCLTAGNASDNNGQVASQLCRNIQEGGVLPGG